MFYLFLYVFIVFIVLLTIGIIWVFWQGKKDFFLNREKGSPFECGYDPLNISRFPFSLRFFLLILFFLVFDMELSLLIQIPLLWNYYFPNIFFNVFFFLFMLTLGYLEEWRRGLLYWKV